MRKNILIIGASSGIGKALASVLTDEGHALWATYHRHEPSTQANTQWVRWDAVNEAFPDGFLPDTLHAVVYCPGSIALKPFQRFTPQDFINDYQLQVVGAVKALRAAQAALKKAESAAVVLFSTVAVQTGFPFHAVVAASKGAIEGLTRALAAEWAPTVRVNAIAPSLTDTPLAAALLSNEEKKKANAQRHPLKRLGNAEEIAQAAAFLLSDAASWITGQVFHIDGGMSSLKI
ncbi:SDR family NAD(P)-dependent oxidoreductase [Thermonema rossianum]|uniref:SDR family NAD(P)-dependent oxidoreductase n=1 Tax=Thermonema rossianum TaxID=55505 RepID=UPI0005715792|nr:SDR family oxidoreductase [Thermonema rossianum]